MKNPQRKRELDPSEVAHKVVQHVIKLSEQPIQQVGQVIVRKGIYSEGNVALTPRLLDKRSDCLFMFLNSISSAVVRELQASGKEAALLWGSDTFLELQVRFLTDCPNPTLLRMWRKRLGRGPAARSSR